MHIVKRSILFSLIDSINDNVELFSISCDILFRNKIKYKCVNIYVKKKSYILV